MKQPHMTKRPRRCAAHSCTNSAAHGRKVCGIHIGRPEDRQQPPPISDEPWNAA